MKSIAIAGVPVNNAGLRSPINKSPLGREGRWMMSKSLNVFEFLASRFALTSALRRMIFGLAVLALASGMAVRGYAQEPATKDEQQPKVHIDWQVGPTVGKLGDVAEIQIPEGY